MRVTSFFLLICSKPMSRSPSTCAVHLHRSGRLFCESALYMLIRRGGVTGAAGARLQIGEGVLEQRDGALRETVGVERLLAGGRLQVVRRLSAPQQPFRPQVPGSSCWCRHMRQQWWKLVLRSCGAPLDGKAPSTQGYCTGCAPDQQTCTDLLAITS